MQPATLFFTLPDFRLADSGVIVNRHIELTEEEKAEARQRAISQYQAEELRKMQQRKSKPAAKPQETKQTEPNLFGF